MANPDYHIDNLPGAQFRAELNDTLTDIKNNKADKTDTDGAIQDLQTNKLEKTATAADSAKLGGLTPDGYARKLHSHTADDLPNGTTTAPGILQLLDSVTSTSTTYAATAKSVKTAYDKGDSAYTLAQSAKTTADAAYPKAGGDLTGTINYTPDTGNVITLDNKTVLYRHTAAGAISFGADDGVVIGCGESRSLTTQNVNMSSEELHLSSDNKVTVRSNLQGGWPSRKEFVFETDGGFKPANVVKTRANLQVYSKSEVYAKGETYNRNEVDIKIPITGYALLDFGEITIKNRYVKDNPFGNSPVFVVTQILVNGDWEVLEQSSSDNNYYGVTSGMHGANNEVIAITTASNLRFRNSTLSHHNGLPTSSNINVAQCRVHVWRLGA